MTHTEFLEYILINSGVDRASLRKIMEIFGEAVAQGLAFHNEVVILGLGKFKYQNDTIQFSPDEIVLADTKRRVKQWFSLGS